MEGQVVQHPHFTVGENEDKCLRESSQQTNCMMLGSSSPFEIYSSEFPLQLLSLKKPVFLREGTYQESAANQAISLSLHSLIFKQSNL